MQDKKDFLLAVSLKPAWTRDDKAVPDDGLSDVNQWSWSIYLLAGMCIIKILF